MRFAVFFSLLNALGVVGLVGLGLGSAHICPHYTVIGCWTCVEGNRAGSASIENAPVVTNSPRILTGLDEVWHFRGHKVILSGGGTLRKENVIPVIVTRPEHQSSVFLTV